MSINFKLTMGVASLALIDDLTFPKQVFVYMYVCMYVCTYVHTYVHTYVCRIHVYMMCSVSFVSTLHYIYISYVHVHVCRIHTQVD